MFAPLGFGQANSLMPGRFAQPQQMPGMGLPQQEMQMLGGMAAAPNHLVSGPGVGGWVGAPISYGAGGFAPQMGQRFAPPASMMPQQGWMNSPFFRGGGMFGGAPQLGSAAGPQLGSAAGGFFGGGMPQHPTVGIPEQPNMPGMPQQLSPAYGRGRFGGGGFR